MEFAGGKDDNKHEHCEIRPNLMILHELLLPFDVCTKDVVYKVFPISHGVEAAIIDTSCQYCGEARSCEEIEAYREVISFANLV